VLLLMLLGIVPL